MISDTAASAFSVPSEGHNLPSAPMGVRQLIPRRQRNVVPVRWLEQLWPEVLLGEFEYGVGHQEVVSFHSLIHIDVRDLRAVKVTLDGYGETHDKILTYNERRQHRVGWNLIGVEYLQVFLEEASELLDHDLLKAVLSGCLEKLSVKLCFIDNVGEKVLDRF